MAEVSILGGLLCTPLLCYTPHRSSKMPFPTNLWAGSLPVEDCAANIMHGVRPGQTEIVGYTEDEVWDHMLAPIQELQRASLGKANLSHLIPLVPRCVPLDSSGSAYQL